MNIDLEKLKSEVMIAMRKATPKDTGNLAYNSMRGYIRQGGLRIVYDGSIAGYGKILNQTLFIQTKKGNHVRLKKNRHFGWHHRATSNAILQSRKFIGDPNIPKNARAYDNRQTATYNPDIPGSDAPMKAQKEKWYGNSARIRFETMNKV